MSIEPKISHTGKVKLSTPEEVEYIRNYLQEHRYDHMGDFDSQMDPDYVSSDYENGTVTIRWIAKKWEMNHIGILHGGIMASILDHTAGYAAYAFLGHWCPTVDIDVKLISQVNLGDQLTCVGQVIHAGARFITCSGNLYNDTNGRLVATGLMEYANGAHAANVEVQPERVD